jgi:ATP:corrinoid adenosyltransferase
MIFFHYLSSLWQDHEQIQMISQETYLTQIQTYEKETEELTLRAKHFTTSCNRALDELTDRLAKISAIETNLLQLIADQESIAKNEWKLIEDKIETISTHTARLDELKRGLCLSYIQIEKIQQVLASAQQEKERRNKLLKAAEVVLDNKAFSKKL